MSHVHHEALPGHHPNTIYFDGCPECDARALQGLRGVLGAMDATRRLEAWQLMRAVHFGDGREMPERELSENDCELVGVLYDVALLMKNAGISPETIERGLQARCRTLTP